MGAWLASGSRIQFLRARGPNFGPAHVHRAPYSDLGCPVAPDGNFLRRGTACECLELAGHPAGARLHGSTRRVRGAGGLRSREASIGVGLCRDSAAMAAARIRGVR